MKAVKLHLSGDIKGEWTRFCIKQGEDGRLNRYLPMEPKPLRKNFMIMKKDFEARNALGSGGGFEHTKDETPLDKLFVDMCSEIERALALARLQKEQKEEINSSKLYFERDILSGRKGKPSKADSDSEDSNGSHYSYEDSRCDEIYKVPSRNVSMLQSRDDEDARDEERSTGDLSDDEEKGTKSYVSKDAAGQVSAFILYF